MVRKDNNNWFVLQVTTGKEFYIKNVIDAHTPEPIHTNIFSTELLYKRNGTFKTVNRILFPGYLFIHQKVKIVLDLFKKKHINGFVKSICLREKKCDKCFIEKSPCMVFPEEMELLLSNSDDSGLFNLSYGYKNGDEINFIKGPLKNLKGNILNINEKKKVVQVEIFLFNRKLKPYLGIDFVN